MHCTLYSLYSLCTHHALPSGRSWRRETRLRGSWMSTRRRTKLPSNALRCCTLSCTVLMFYTLLIRYCPNALFLVNGSMLHLANGSILHLVNGSIPC
jgi:hypothetical protein